MTKVTVSLLKVGPKLFPIMKNIMMDTKNKVIISLLEVILGLLQFLHPVTDLQDDLRLMKMVPNYSLYQ